MLKIAYACNDKMFECLYLSILSIVRRCKENIQFYIITADFIEYDRNFTKITDDHVTILKNMIGKYNKNSNIEIIDCKKIYESNLRNNPNATNRCSIYALLRLLLGKFSFFKDKFLYLDTDTMACGNILELFKQDTKDNEFLVCHNNPTIRWYQNKMYFNSGVILFNANLVKEHKTLDKAISLVCKKKLLNPDQDALYRASTKFDFFEDEYRFNRQNLKIKQNDIIKHFCRMWERPIHGNIKQNDVKRVQKCYKIHVFDEDYKIFEKMKEEARLFFKNDFFITINNLNKSYGELKAVDNISFKVKKGSLFAFLGINGAGKSTTINIISSTLAKDSGEVKIAGFDLDKENAEVKKRIGIVFQNSVLDNLLSVEDNLKIRGQFYRMSRTKLKQSIDNVVKMLRLEPILKQDVGKLSGGQKRRVDIARALIHEPELLMLDEPTTGLDPKTRQDVWHLIDDIRKRTNMTVFLTTHYLEEAEKATYVVIMNKGKVIAEGTPNELKNRHSSDYVISYQKQDDKFEEVLNKKYKFIYDNDAGAYKISVKNSSEARKVLKEYSTYIKDFEIKKGDMDDVFLNVTGNKK